MKALASIAPIACMGLVFWGIIHMTSCVTDDSRYQVVAVKSRPQDGFDTLEKTYGCTASVIRNIPATRYFASGRQQEYVIRGVIGYRNICK